MAFADALDASMTVSGMSLGSENGPHTYTPGLDDSSWEWIAVPSAWEESGYPGYDGIAWYRRQVVVPPTWAGLDLLLELLAADDEDTTSYQGVEVGAADSWNQQRLYRIDSRHPSRRDGRSRDSADSEQQRNAEENCRIACPDLEQQARQ